MKPFIRALEEMDVRGKAWKISRPNIYKENEDVGVKDYEYTDLSCNSLKVVALHIRSSLAFRELLSSIRPHFMWAQTSRVNSIEEMELSPLASEQAISYMKEAKESIEGQDRRRLLLPMATLTEYTIALDFRTWISFLKTLKEFYPVYWKSYGKEILVRITGIGSKQDLTEWPYGQIYTKNDKENFRSKFNSLTDFTQSIPTGIFLSIRNLTLALRSQVARHIRLSIEDELWLGSYDEIGLEELRLTDQVKAWIYIPSKIFIPLIQHRSCWIAQFEIWEPLIELISSAYEFKETIPCNGTYQNCPFRKDNEARIEGKDPNTPCPLSIPMGENSINIRRRMSGNSKTLERWENFIYEKTL